MKKILYFGALAVIASACSDSFLEEEMVSTITQDYFGTEQGLDQLIVSTYNAERVRNCYSDQIYVFECAHDCGYVPTKHEINGFSSSVWSETGSMATYANYVMGFQSKQQSGFLIECYPIIDACNKAIGSIRSGQAKGRYSTDAAYAAQGLSEALFNRAYMFYTLNGIYGDIYMPQTSITTMPAAFDYPRQSSEEIYKQIIGDLRYAFENLPAQWPDASYGRVTKYAAAHLLAKLYLQRYQGKDYGTAEYGRKADGTIDNSNEKSYLGMLYKGPSTVADLDSAIYFATQVIESGKYQLEPVYSDIFKTGIGDWSNESSKEIILAGMYANGTDNGRYGNRSCCHFLGDYTNKLWGIPEYTWEYGPNRNTGFHMNDWGFDVFTDKLNDARFQGSFRLEYTTMLNTNKTTPTAGVPYYAYNDKSNSTYTWTQEQADYFNANILPTYDRESWGGRAAVANEHKMGTGDIAVAYVENTKATAIDIKEIDAQPYVVCARWVKNGSEYYYRPQMEATGTTYSFINSKGTSNTFYGLETSTNPMKGIPFSTKYDDMNRSAVNGVYGTRDFPVFRFAETYLIRAEAYGRKQNWSAAIADINTVRARAAFKAGQTRNEVLARLYPGRENLAATERQYPYTVAADATAAMMVDASYWDGTSANSQKENYCPAANTEEKRFVEFIYNEYAREFAQELMYQENIHHAGIQAQRIQWHNQLASNPNNTTYAAGKWDTCDNCTTNGQTGAPKGSFQNYMTLYPFSRSAFITLITDENGTVLSEDARKAYQNYGYNK